MPERQVVVVGDALIDELRNGDLVREFVGGAALNVAAGLAILGVRTTLIAMIGDDADGERIRSFLTSFGVELVPTIGPRGSSRAVSDRTEGEPAMSSTSLPSIGASRSTPQRTSHWPRRIMWS